jgi:hypothetical protein
MGNTLLPYATKHEGSRAACVSACGCENHFVSKANKMSHEQDRGKACGNE